MPREYMDHILCKQMRILIEEEVLRDTEVVFKLSSATMRVSAFLLSLVSPVFHKMVCGAFRESVNKQLALDEVAEEAFCRTIDLACGKDGFEVKGLGDVIELAKLADKFQMSGVVAALEDVIMRHLTVDVCVEVLSACTEDSLSRVMEAGRCLVLSRFEEVANTIDFRSITEDTLSSLLDDDTLIADCEERVFEALVKWMKADDGNDELRGHSLLRTIRFPLMDAKYLGTRVQALVPEAPCLKDIVIESLVVKQVPNSERGDLELRHLGPKALVPRLGRGVSWDKYLDSGEKKLGGHTGLVFALVECAGRVCSGSGDGTIMVWNKSTLESERTLAVEEDVDYVAVWSLTVWGDHLISGDTAGRVRVWDVSSGHCDRVLEGHTGGVRALTVCGSRLLSGSSDNTVKIWALGTAVEWPCERTLTGHSGVVRSLATWQDRAMSGSGDDTIRVWDVATGAHQATLTGHAGAVTALLVLAHGRRLVSSSLDGTMRVWALGTWEPQRTVRAYGPESQQFGYRLAVSGPRLVSGSALREEPEDDEREEWGAGGCEVRVWELGSLECRHTLRQAPGAEVRGLLALRGPGGPEVWAAVGEVLVVWGRE